MHLSPDEILVFHIFGYAINATLVYSVLTVLFLSAGSWLITRRLTDSFEIPRGQNLLEVIVSSMRGQIRDVVQQDPDPYLPFIGTLFLYIAISNILGSLVPGFQAATGSLSTTAALALCVAVAVPYFGITRNGWKAYLREYLQPSPLMLPFNIIGEVTRTLALAVRLMGNIMSGAQIILILLMLTPLFVPVLMRAFGLLTGLVQAYIFAVLAMVYIASATRLQEERTQQTARSTTGDDQIG